MDYSRPTVTEEGGWCSSHRFVSSILNLRDYTNTGAHEGTGKKKTSEGGKGKRGDFQKLNVLKKWIVKLKGDAKASELLMQPLGELQRIMHISNRLKID